MFLLTLDPLIIRMIECGIGAMLLIGTWQKIKDLPMFQAAVEAYGLIPLANARLFSLAYVCIEFIIAICLISNIASSLAVISAITLMCIITFAISINLLRGNTDLSCGCGGIEDEQKLSWPLVSRNIVILLMLIICLNEVSSRSYDLLDTLNFFFGTISIYLIYLLSSQLISNHEKLIRLREEL